MSERVRLFCALELPARVREGLHAWAAPIAAADPSLRLLGPDALHVTLVFLGWQDGAAIEPIAAATLAAARPLPELGVTGAAWLPPRRPGVLVADLTAPEPLAALQARLAAALRAFHRPEGRPFRPHVTVARVRRGARPRVRDVPPPPQLAFGADALVLHRSHLGRGGATYEPLARASL